MEIRPYQVYKEHTTLDGTIKRDIVTQKNIYILEFRHLAQSEVSQIMNIYAGKAAVTFSVSDGDLTINDTSVWVDYESRQYNTRGSEYREDLRLILKEV